MIQIKLRRLVSNSWMLVGVIFYACHSEDRQNRMPNMYGDEWKASKILFYENCSQCHVPRIKDEIFERFNKKLVRLPESEKIVMLKSILYNGDHFGDSRNIKSMDEKELKSLVLFIETPQRRDAVH